jgi:NAD(P)H-dependent FMN reductase
MKIFFNEWGGVMSYKPKILAFAGSLRKASFNKKLVKIAAKGAQDAGAEVTYIDLSDYPLPLFNEDEETAQGLPANAAKLKELMIQHDGFLIASPEYNSSIPAVLKNIIDWVSRPRPGEPYLNSFIDKAVVLMSASPGDLGGLRCLVQLRALFGNIFSIVLPQQKSIRKADEAFDEAGHLKDIKKEEEVRDLGKRLADFLKKYKST